jgi:hypothetical protein
MRHLLPTPGDVDPVDTYARLAALVPPSMPEPSHVFEAEVYLFLRHRRR